MFLNFCSKTSAECFQDDIDLISKNAIDYNNDPNYETNKVICHRAKALQDFAYALVKAEMVSKMGHFLHNISPQHIPVCPFFSKSIFTEKTLGFKIKLSD